MMGRALLVVGWLATVGFLAAAVTGYLVTDRDDLALHLLLALLSSLLLLFSHCWIMFYLIGTGKAVRLTVQEHGFEEQMVDRTRHFKAASYPWLTLAMGMAIATFVLGGGVNTGVIPGWMHWSLFYLTFAVQVRTLLIEHRVLAENEAIIQEINRRLLAADNAAAATGGGAA